MISLKFKKFDGVGAPVPIELIIENISPDLTFGMELSFPERTVKLNIPFSEVYHRCSEPEWQDLLSHASKTLGVDIQSEYERSKNGWTSKFAKFVRSLFQN